MTAPGTQALAVESGSDRPRFVVTVGTDHHPFDRLIGWVNEWLAAHPARVPAFFVQWGSSAVAPVCAGSAFLDATQLAGRLGEADVIICHGGPGSMADAWQRGQVPIVVPRLRRFGEVVDDHQVDFCDKLASLGRVRLAPDKEAFARLLDEATGDLAGFRASGPGPDTESVVAKFGTLVDELLSRPARRRTALNHRSGPREGT